MTIGEPDIEGFVDVNFNKYIRLPGNCSKWNNENEGNDRIKIEFVPSPETQEIIYDQDLDIILSWQVDKVFKKSPTV